MSESQKSVVQSAAKVFAVLRAFDSAQPELILSDIVRRVRRDGYTSLKGHQAKLSQAFVGLNVAVRPATTDGLWNVFFMRFGIAKLDLRGAKAHSETVKDVSEHLSRMSPA
jgi:hypothetical protein